ncbi:WXG100 family type VII secretion target [Nocardia arthritidis]|uniref:ESAT-6-like protein n=1 Tax=Nocardia arthritidis TaxID=228602 RepID=A0A6G9Y924_9NOCA|nr:WXG100 family type VII secretion target [Nocardia arthritidis]QIS09722.1 WXG100 family type VII secretion target [Nocardia arthritidis]
MAQQILQVDPDHLRRGAGRFDEHHGDMCGVLADIHHGHDQLQDSWSGAAADTVREVWDDMHPRIRTHVDRIATYAADLNSAATAYDGTDAHSGSEISGAAVYLEI